MRLKSIFLFLFVVCGTVFNAQESIQFEDKSFAEILNKAKKEKKIIFMDAFAAWCGPCKMMEKNTFPKESVRSFYNANFINARFDMEKGEGREIAKKYQVYSYPTFLFLNGDGEIVHKSYGYQEEAEFLQVGKNVLENAKGGLTMRQRFENGESDPAFLFEMFVQNYQTDSALAKQVSERYFQRKKEPAFTQQELMMLIYFLRSSEDPNYRVFANAKKEILKFVSEEEYKQMDTNYKLNSLLNKYFDEKRNQFNDPQFLQEAYKLVSKEEADLFSDRFKVKFYSRTGNFAEFSKVASRLYKDGEGFDANELYLAAYQFSQNSKDSSQLKQALTWAEKVVMKGPNTEVLFLVAKLYHQNGKKEEAKMYAEQLRMILKQSNLDTTQVDNLLKELN